MIAIANYKFTIHMNYEGICGIGTRMYQFFHNCAMEFKKIISLSSIITYHSKCLQMHNSGGW